MRNKKLILAPVVGLVFVIGFLILGKFNKGRPDPEYAAQLAATQQFLDEHATQLRELDERLDAMKALVTQDEWIPAEETVASIGQGDLFLFWAHELRGEEYSEFDDMRSGRSYTDLESLEPVFEWLDDPSMIDAQSDLELARLEGLLSRAGARYVAVAELLDVSLPEITKLDLGSKTGEIGQFTAGKTTFAVVVLDTKSMQVTACGRGEATNKDEIRAIDGPASDLWSRTREAAIEVARRVSGDVAEAARRSKGSSGNGDHPWAIANGSTPVLHFE